MLKKGAVFRIRGVAVARLELYGWEQVDSKWRGATRVLAPAGSIRNGFTFFRSASAGPAFMRGGGTACRQPAFMLKGGEGIIRRVWKESFLLRSASRKTVIPEH